MGRRGDRLQVLAGARAGEETPGPMQARQRRLVVDRALGLRVRGVRPTLPGSLVPVEPEPREVRERRRRGAGHRPRWIEVLQPPDEGAPSAAYREPGRQRRPRATDVERPRRRRRPAAAGSARRLGRHGGKAYQVELAHRDGHTTISDVCTGGGSGRGRPARRASRRRPPWGEGGKPRSLIRWRVPRPEPGTTANGSDRSPAAPPEPGTRQPLKIRAGPSFKAGPRSRRYPSSPLSSATASAAASRTSR